MSTIAPTVLITVPKFVSITPNRTLPKLQPALKLTDNNKMLSANPDATALRATSPASSGYASSDGTPAKGKKRRLDHLTWEEKIQRKKLKNRVAAQTSRDRKKARMEDMEHEIKELKEQSEILRNKCDSLININDSLLEKNGKLDKEVEILRQQLEDIKKQQQLNNSTAACQNCAFLALNGSAAGITNQGPTECTNSKSSSNNTANLSTVENYNTLPALQDMFLLNELQNVNEDDFDANRLEELAESLLADITADLEASDSACNQTTTEIASNSERLPGSVVGPTTECLESDRYKTRTTGNDHIESVKSILQNNLLSSDTTTTTTTKTTVEPLNTNAINTTDNVVYGTYDASTNSITIVLDDDSEPVQEAVEEISSETECSRATAVATPAINLQMVKEEDDSDFEDMLNFDPISKYLRPKRTLITPLAHSPTLSLASAASSHDHGYESILGSPSSRTATDPFVADIDNDIMDFDELFPDFDLV